MAIEGTQAETLDNWLKARSISQLSLRDTVYFIRLAAEALQHAHDQQQLYLDVRPQNILISPNETATELPLLQLVPLAEQSTQTRGTSLYMAPEQWGGQPQAASDQYALGIMAYQLLTGQLPFAGDVEQLMTQHATLSPQPPSTLNKHLPVAIDVVILRALVKKPKQRFPSVSSFAQALQQAVEYSDLHATLTLSPLEAQNGTERVIMLPGKRQVKISIPAQAHNRQILQIAGQGETYYDGGPRGILILTLSVKANAAGAGQGMEDTMLQKSLPKPQTALSSTPASSPSQNIEIAVLSEQPVTPPTIPVYQRYPQTQGIPALQAQPVAAVAAASLPLTQPAPQPFPQAGRGHSKRPGIIVSSSPYIKHRSHRIRTFLFIILVLLIILASTAGILAYFRLHRTTPTPSRSSVTNNKTDGTAITTTLNQNTPTASDATATAMLLQDNPNPYSKATSVLQLDDPLINNSKDTRWQLTSTPDGACRFNQGSYYIDTNKNNYPFFCAATAPTYSQVHNLVYEAQITIKRGDAGGIGFRLASTDTFASYYFRVTQDGYYALVLFGPTNRVLISGASSTINTGLDNMNTLAVVAIGNKIDLYINHIYVNTVNDSTYTQGQIALIANDLTTATEVKFNNVRLWVLQ